MALASSAPRRCGVALQPRRRSRCPPRAAAASPAAAAGDSEECAATFVTATNAAGEAHTTIRLQAAEFPGLLRVIAWALQGLSIHVARAMLHTTSDGVAEDVLLVTDAAGQPLTDDRAACVASRLAGLLDTCVRARVGDPSLLERGPVLIDSSLSPAWSLVRVKNEEPGKQQQGVFLQLTSVLAGLGLSIREANAEADGEWSFIVSDHAGKALTYGVATALLELLSVGVGRVQPIRVPLFKE